METSRIEEYGNLEQSLNRTMQYGNNFVLGKQQGDRKGLNRTMQYGNKKQIKS